MKQQIRRDDLPSDDWEITGQEEMNALQEQCGRRMRMVCVRDELSHLQDLVEVCAEALLGSSKDKSKSIHYSVARVLNVFVANKIKDLEEELLP